MVFLMTHQWAWRWALGVGRRVCLLLFRICSCCRRPRFTLFPRREIPSTDYKSTPTQLGEPLRRGNSLHGARSKSKSKCTQSVELKKKGIEKEKLLKRLTIGLVIWKFMKTFALIFQLAPLKIRSEIREKERVNRFGFLITITSLDIIV